MPTNPSKGTLRPPAGPPSGRPPGDGASATGSGTRRPVAPATGTFPALYFPMAGDVLNSSRGSYLVGEKVGRGAYGAVYQALGPFDQRFALKLLVPANRAYHEVQKEWSQEAARLLALRHPGVVYMHDAFEAGHLFYMALEWCPHTLKDLLVEPLSPGLVIDLARQILAAVQYLHDNDLVHTDLHAGNVLLTLAEKPTVKIADFGISQELRGQGSARPPVVHHAIMAPEVIKAGYTTRQSDIYQIGLLLYRMLTGYEAIDYSLGYDELVQQVAEGRPRQAAEAMGTPFGNVIAKMLRRREAYRYQSCHEVWKDMRQLPEAQALRYGM